MARVNHAWGNLAGVKFGKLTAIEEVGKDKCGHYLWKCKCQCGRTSVTRASNLATGHTTSCGCSRITYKGEK